MTTPTRFLHAIEAMALAAVLFSTGAACAADAGADTAAPASAPTAQVQTVAARQGPIATVVHAYGSIGFATADLVTLNVPYAAQITRLKAAIGQPVSKGAVLAEMTSDPAVAAAFVQAQSTSKSAREELVRTQSLYAKQLATQSQLAVAQKAAADADTTLAELVRQGARPGPRTIVAPFDGVVVNIAAAQGDRLAAGATVLQMGRGAAPGAAHAMLGVDPSQAPKVRAGAPVRVAPLDGAGAGAADARAYGGHVAAVRQILNTQTRLVDVSVTLDPSGSAPLLPGTLVSAEIEIARSTHWIVPRSALLQDAQGEYVYQVASGHAHRIGVRQQVESGDQYGVDGDLVAGQPLVTVGNYELSDGMGVTEAAR